MKNYIKIFSHIPKSFHVTFIIMCFFSSLVAFIELIGVAAILPLISLLSEPNYVERNIFHAFVHQNLGSIDKIKYIYYLSIITIFFFISRGFLNIFFIYKVSSFSLSIYKYYQSKILEKFINSSYLHYVNKTKMGDYLKVMTKETTNISVITNCFMLILSEILVFITLLTVLIFINFKATIFVLILLSFIGIVNLKFLSKKISDEGKKREKIEGQIYFSLKELYSGFKLIKFLPSIDKIEKLFKDLFNIFSSSNIRNQTLQSIPRVTMETSAFIIVIFIVVFLGMSEANNKENISTLSFFLLAILRILPSINRIISNHYIIVYSLPAIDAMNSQLDIPQDLRDQNCHNFKNEIKLKNVDFFYDDENIVFNKINLTINKGDKVVVTGPSGSGKTTLIDLITGLIKPTKGSLLIDNVNITNKNTKICNKDISYFDQNIYMSNDTIGNNIALGRKKDRKKMMSVIKRSYFLSDKKNESILDLQIGEAGSKLSGGQKQRIAIARTLYADAKIHIFDEPTSSLDDDTALDLVKNLFLTDNNKTVIVIDHRGHFKKYANKIIQIRNKSVFVETN